MFSGSASQIKGIISPGVLCRLENIFHHNIAEYHTHTHIYNLLYLPLYQSVNVRTNGSQSPLKHVPNIASRNISRTKIFRGFSHANELYTLLTDTHVQM